MLTTMRSSWIGSPEPPSTVSQSPPVTVNTRPSVVSREDAYELNCASFGSRLRGSQAHSSRSPVGPPLVGRRDLRALVLHGNATERVVLALRVAFPVVRHEDAGETR